MNAMLALAPVETWGLGQWLIVLLAVGGACAVFYIVWTKALGWPFPPWLLQIVGVIVGVVIGIMVIKFLLSLL